MQPPMIFDTIVARTARFREAVKDSPGKARRSSRRSVRDATDAKAAEWFRTVSARYEPMSQRCFRALLSTRTGTRSSGRELSTETPRADPHLRIPHHVPVDRKSPAALHA